MKKEKELDLPDLDMLVAELNREQKRHHSRGALGTVLLVIVVLAALGAVVVTQWVPVLKIKDSSMTRTLRKNDIVLAVSGSDVALGDICAIPYGNRTLARRVIAQAGQIVDIDENGTVTVDGVLLDEPYVAVPAQGEYEISFPCTVPDSCCFVLCDNRSYDLDSRDSSFGCVLREDIIGRVTLRIWPLSRFGSVE